MSKYTTEVRFICETLAEYDMSQGYGKVSEIISKSWNKIFDFDFPIFDENYRSVLCTKILKHYYTREIGLETVGLWKLKLDTKMNEIMPYYNQLYLSTFKEFDPFNDADYTKQHEGSGEGQSVDTGSRQGTSNDETHNETDSTVWDVYSDTPQGALTHVEDETYLTNARKIITDREDNGTANRSFSEGSRGDRNYTNTDEYFERIKGKFPGRSYSYLLKEYRDTFINVDMRVINELKELFMEVW